LVIPKQWFLINKFLFNYRNQPATQHNIVPLHRVFSYRPRWLTEIVTSPGNTLNYNTNEVKQSVEFNKEKTNEQKTTQVNRVKLELKEGEEVYYTTLLKGESVNHQAKILKKQSEYMFTSLSCEIEDYRRISIR
jgi:hypothetical protein